MAGLLIPFSSAIFSHSISLHQASKRLQCERWTMTQDHLWTNNVRHGLKAALSVWAIIQVRGKKMGMKKWKNNTDRQFETKVEWLIFHPAREAFPCMMTQFEMNDSKS